MQSSTLFLALTDLHDVVVKNMKFQLMNLHRAIDFVQILLSVYLMFKGALVSPAGILGV